MAHGDAVTAPITAERLAEIEAQLDELACSDHGCVVSKPKGMGTNGGCRCIPRESTPDGRGRIRKVLTLRQQQADALVAEVRRLTAALEIARREGAEAMRERCDDAITARLVEAVREVREKTYRGTGAEKDIATAVWEAIDAMRDTVRALPLDAPGGER